MVARKRGNTKVFEQLLIIGVIFVDVRTLKKFNLKHKFDTTSIL